MLGGLLKATQQAGTLTRTVGGHGHGPLLLPLRGPRSKNEIEDRVDTGSILLSGETAAHFEGREGAETGVGAVPGSPDTQFPVLSLFWAQARWAHVTGPQGHISALAPAAGPAWLLGEPRATRAPSSQQGLSRTFSAAPHTRGRGGRLL